MSGLYAYCVLGAGQCPPSGLTGLDDGSVRSLDVDALSVWVSDRTSAPSLNLDAVRRHHEVVDAAIEHDVIPLRFGSWHPGEAALAAAMRRTSDSLREALERVSGRVEMGVRVGEGRPDASHPSEPVFSHSAPRPVRTHGTPAEAAAGAGPVSAPAGSVSGRDYLRALSRRNEQRTARRRVQDAVAQALAAALGDVVEGQRLSPLDPPDVVAVAHLVERCREGDYRAGVAAFVAGCGARYDVHVTGPWPPYSFTER